MIDTKIRTFLKGRGIPEMDAARLGIRYVTYKEATTQLGFGTCSTSPDGVIFFPFAPGSKFGAARNWYNSKEAEAHHLAQLNEWQTSQGKKQFKHVPKYLLPSGTKAGVLYDPYTILRPETQQPIILGTEDVIGAEKAAIRGIRVISTFGVWLGLKADVEASKDPDWRHSLEGKFPAYLADSDAIHKPSVAAALIRTGILIKCRIGCFPAQGKDKVGFDEWLDANPTATAETLQALVSENAMGVFEWLATLLPSHVNWLQERGYVDTEATLIAGKVKAAILSELFKHYEIADLRANGFYDKVLKPIGTNLEILKNYQLQSQLEAEEPKSQPLAELVVNLCTQECELYHDAEKEVYADVIVDGCRHTYRLRSVEFKRWVARRLHENFGRCLNSDAFTAARTTLEAVATYEGKETKVWLRVGDYNGKIYLDLCNEKWQAVEIDTQGWRIVDCPPVRFWRPNSMLPLPTPVEGGNLEDFKKLMGLDADTPEAKRTWFILVTFWIYCLTPFGDYPILLLAACRGSGKTTITEAMKGTIDPGKAPLIHISGDAHKVGVAGSRRWLMAYDNVSYISEAESDILCRVATGFGHSTRTLFETEGETNFDFSRPQVITAIDHVVTRDDLADRLLMAQLPEIDKSKRLSKQHLKAKLEAMKPGILGALLTLLSQALAIRETLEDKDLPRLADYGKLAIAAERALGIDADTEEGFVKIFEANREMSRQVVLESSPVAGAIMGLVSDLQSHGGYEGTATDLLSVLETRVQHGATSLKSWTKAPNSLVRQLNRLKPDLKACGIEIQFGRNMKTNEKTIHLQKLLPESREQ
ncbi:hypothetical protein RIF25_10525 [Thermosynechococcaceae cyanobacterium BACA0444]|uniref:DUF3854 domain-containing protein n=1 Tax=Pseudocalidococcus azoricus BACA0444 TaxID=2918990 RepID=A0AAE4FSD8_9CYAN|nr:hypothetical protein [Pseudocalidococcus azoricus]MDS3861241.1 hypothetical protein [Pseudocalidococcus azoricus BACA0444]